ncbi:hypothetical protein PG995_005017 [Apiospora arundinis]
MVADDRACVTQELSLAITVPLGKKHPFIQYCSARAANLRRQDGTSHCVIGAPELRPHLPAEAPDLMQRFAGHHGLGATEESGTKSASME